ncbi:MAG: TonB-dependent siderophore receptor [Burkholderiales bacterium]|nr:TonB-dependent siderophore receptor [Burkholderiales bacterium]
MPRFRRTAIAISVASIAGASASLAQTPAPESTLPEIRVKAATPPPSPYGPDEGYRAERSTAGTKTDTPLSETPQSVTIVTRQRIEDQGATSLQDALNYAAGVRSDAYGLDSRTDSVRVRGAYPDEYLDGLRRTYGYYTSNTRFEPYALERIEVLRGPSAMLYGQGGTGGILNMVSKRPQDEPRREIGVQFGSFGRRQVQADLTGPITKDGEWLYRLVAVGRDSGTHVDFVPDDRVLLAPSLTWRPNAATTLTLLGSWQDDKSGSTSQFFPWSGTLLPNPNGPIPPERFIGNPGIDRYDSQRAEAGWQFEHKVNDRWTFRQNFRYAWNEVHYYTAYADSFSNPSAPYIDAAQRVLDRFGWFDERKNRILTADQHVEGHFLTGSVEHRLLVGLDFASFRETSLNAFDFTTRFGGTLPPIDVYAPAYAPYTPPPLAANPKSTQRSVGVYVQDQLRIGNRWIVVGGLRYDDVTSGLEGAPGDKDHATTGRAGVMYRFDGGITPYLSYSESFTPLAGTNLAGVRWTPMRGEQVEAGVKWDVPGKKLSVNAAVYDLKEKNRQVPDPTNPLDQVQTGATRTSGLELEATGQLLRNVDIAAHYNYTDIDEKLEGLPRHQAALWTTTRFALGETPGFLAGLGVRYMGNFRDVTGPEIPDLTLFDGMLGYDQGPWRFAVNVQNLTDKIYFATCLGRGDCWYGARRTVLASARYRF